jgi:hypothetical protein
VSKHHAIGALDFVTGHYVTSRKVAGSRPDYVDFFFSILPNPSGRTMAPGSTQPLTEMSTRNLKKETWC